MDTFEKTGKETIHNQIICIYTVYTLEHGGSFWMMIKPLKNGGSYTNF